MTPVVLPPLRASAQYVPLPGSATARAVTLNSLDRNSVTRNKVSGWLTITSTAFALPALGPLGGLLGVIVTPLTESVKPSEAVIARASTAKPG